jgi:hypothetical protein
MRYDKPLSYMRHGNVGPGFVLVETEGRCSHTQAINDSEGGRCFFVSDGNKFCSVVVELTNAKRRKLYISSFERNEKTQQSRTCESGAYLVLEIRSFLSGNHLMCYITKDCCSAEKRQDHQHLRPNDGLMLVLGQLQFVYAVIGCWPNFTRRAALVLC